MQRSAKFTVACICWCLQGIFMLAAAQQPYAAHRPTFMLFGDSLTEFGTGYHWKYTTDKKGWTALLSEAYSRKADIINRGMSGYNSRWALQVLPQALIDLGCSGTQRRSGFLGRRAAAAPAGRCNVALLTILFGTNDAVDKAGADGRLHVPVDEYQKNLAAMVAAAKAAGVQQVLLITPPPVDEAAWASEHGLEASDRTNTRVDQYVAAVREVAKQQAVPLLDLHSIFSQQEPQQLKQLLNDGVHFSPQGNELLFKSLRDALETRPEFAGIRSADLPNHFPLFNQIDAANPGKTFKELFERQVVTPPLPPQKAGPTQLRSQFQ